MKWVGIGRVDQEYSKLPIEGVNRNSYGGHFPLRPPGYASDAHSRDLSRDKWRRTRSINPYILVMIWSL